MASAVRLTPGPNAITVVNNDPADPEPRALASRIGVSYLEPGANVGFCAAVNLALERSSEPFVLLLNSDAIVAPDYVERLVAHMKADRSIASSGGRILRGTPKATIGVDSTGIRIGRGRTARDIGHGTLDDGVRMGVEEPFGVTAAAAVYRRSALEDVAVAGQVLPESFFMYLDDVDLAWRLRLGGHRAVVDHAAVAWHARASAGGPAGGSSARLPILDKLAWESTRPEYVRERSWVNHLLMLVRNDDPGPFLGQFPYYAIRRLPGDLYGLVQRPSMAIRMRRRFLELLPGALKQRREIQARRVVSAHDMARWLP